MAIKFLLCGFEKRGKSTIASKIHNNLVINFDKKEYSLKVPHVNIKEYSGIDPLTNLINSKIEAYQDKFGHLPSVVTLDTVTQLYSSMQKYNASKYTGFNVHSANSNDTLAFNDYIENVLIANGISVCILAHTAFDSDTGRFVIPATGQFSKAGSWLSIVNDGSFVDLKNNKLVIYHTDMKYPCRSTIPDMPEYENVDDYDINTHFDKLTSKKLEAEEFML